MSKSLGRTSLEGNNENHFNRLLNRLNQAERQKLRQRAETSRGRNRAIEQKQAEAETEL